MKTEIINAKDLKKNNSKIIVRETTFSSFNLYDGISCYLEEKFNINQDKILEYKVTRDDITLDIIKIKVVVESTNPPGFQKYAFKMRDLISFLTEYGEMDAIYSEQGYFETH